MKVRMSVLLVVFLVFYPLSAFAHGEGQWTDLDHVASDALLFAKHKEYDKAVTLLNHFMNEFQQIKDQQPFTDSQILVLHSTYGQAKDALTSTSMTYRERIQRVTQFRLAVDAMNSAYQPMWAEMESTVMSSFNDMKASLLAEDQSVNINEINQFLQTVNTIYPSLVIDLTPEQLSLLDEHLTFLEQYGQLSHTKQVAQLDQLETDLVQLFQTLHMEQTDPSFLSVTSSIASVIFFTLFYVAWRKYRGGKRIVSS